MRIYSHTSKSAGSVSFDGLTGRWFNSHNSRCQNDTRVQLQIPLPFSFVWFCRNSIIWILPCFFATYLSCLMLKYVEMQFLNDNSQIRFLFPRSPQQKSQGGTWRDKLLAPCVFPRSLSPGICNFVSELKLEPEATHVRCRLTVLLCFVLSVCHLYYICYLHLVYVYI